MNFETLGTEWQGRDASLAISLFEHGFIWRPVGNIWEIIYRTDFGRFAAANYLKHQPVTDAIPLMRDQREQDSISSYVGEPWVTFLTREIPEILATLVQYYGHENIFGSNPSCFPIEPEKPDEVASVELWARASAVCANYNQDRVFVYYARERSPTEWVVADNYDTGITGGSLIYRTGTWFWRRWCSEEPDVALVGGFEEAKVRAATFFTG